MVTDDHAFPPRTFDADVDPGTTELEWGDQRHAPFDLAECSRIVVVAPHPDDEILGIGGLLHRANAAGIEVVVVAVTDGAASHPGSPTLSPDDLRRIRPVESERALRQLGIDRPPVRLAFEDGDVSGSEQPLADAVSALLTPQTWCFAPWRGDRHPDHEAAGRASAAAVAVTGATLVEYPIWMWHWARPGHDDVPWDRGRSIELTETELLSKTTAVAEFRSQTTALSDHPADRAVLPAHILARFARPTEVVFV